MSGAGAGAGERPARRSVLRGGAALAGLGAFGGFGGFGGLAYGASSAYADDADSPYLVGRGIADVTGEIAEVGMMGYGRVDQQAEGLHARLRARAFVVVDRAGGERVALVVADLGMIFDSVHRAVLRRLAERYGGLYTARNVLLAATHTHAGPGGHAHHVLYNLTTLGFHRQTFAAITDGIVEALARAHDDLAPSTLRLSHGELRDASANRSLAAFRLNPADITGQFPDGIDPQTTLLRVERGGRAVGAVNWFATHGTSMSGDNRLIGGDNKGYAAYHWERLVAGGDYLSPGGPDFVAAFAQTNAGDMSPNLSLTPPTHPEDIAAARACGLRQYEAAAGQLAAAGAPVTGPVDSRLVHVDLSAVTVGPAFTGDGRAHTTAPPAVGAAMAAGSMEDGPAFPGFVEGENPLWDAISDAVIYEVSPELREAHAPKDIVVPIGAMNDLFPWVQEIVPVQLLRVGQLYLVGVPGEVTIGAGLRLRRTVAEAVGAGVRDVLVAGYAGAYFHYLTTPEEYDAQQYEGGSTLFGRWQLPALQQTAAGLARAMAEGREVPTGPGSPDIADKALSFQPGVVWDTPPAGSDFGDVLTEPEAAYAPGQRVTAVFAGAHPSNDPQRGGTYLLVQRRSGDGDAWEAVADDGDWSTVLRWAREGVAASRVTITWDVPEDAAPGTYRIRYTGDAKALSGRLRGFSGTTRAFAVAG
ncbi:neutral/alkaline ceramidase [Streptomyces sp. 6N223]|uniref:neutral/alkaline ceramidase n=1 Tax=Streptomyces sp. 6N223 TaxID=3457412 RepID=UPI003FCF38D4